MQVNCGIGREQVESWGRKKRSIGSGGSGGRGKLARTDGQTGPGTGKPLGDDMTLSREIVVLDLKDKPADAADAQSRDDLASSGDGFVQKSPLKSSQAAADQSLEGGSLSSSTTTNLDSESASSLQAGANLHCLSSQSLLWLTCSIGLFFVLYVCLVAYFFSRRDTKISVIKHQYH
jgi:hypothetical protein